MRWAGEHTHRVCARELVVDRVPCDHRRNLVPPMRRAEIAEVGGGLAKLEEVVVGVVPQIHDGIHAGVHGAVVEEPAEPVDLVDVGVLAVRAPGLRRAAKQLPALGEEFLERRSSLKPPRQRARPLDEGNESPAAADHAAPLGLGELRDLPGRCQGDAVGMVGVLEVC